MTEVLGVVLPPGERYPGIAFRFWAASSAASDREIAEGDLRALNENLGLGANVARVSDSFSWRALMA